MIVGEVLAGASETVIVKSFEAVPAEFAAQMVNVVVSAEVGVP